MIRDLIFGGAGSTALVEGWNLSTATSAGSLGLSLYSYDCAVSTKGDYLYIIKYDNNTLYQYSLSTPYLVSSASLVRSKAMTSSLGEGIWFYADGSFFVVHSNGSDDSYKYVMSTPWDISTATLVSGSLNASGQSGDSRGVYLSPNGLYAYISSMTPRVVLQYTMSTPFDLTTATYTRSAAPGFDFSDMWFNSSGTKMYAFGGLGPARVVEYLLSTSWDISTISSNYTFNIGSINPSGIAFNSIGTRMYVMDYSVARIYQYNLTS